MERKVVYGSVHRTQPVKENSVMVAWNMPIRDAIRAMLKKAYIAKETGNRHAYTEIRYWLKRHIRLRNTGRKVYWKA